MVEEVEGTLELEWDCSPVAAAAPTFNRPPGAAALALALPAIDEPPVFGAPPPPPPLAACEAEAEAPAAAVAAVVAAAVVAPRVAIARPRAMSCGGAKPGGPGGCVARQYTSRYSVKWMHASSS